MRSTFMYKSHIPDTSEVEDQRVAEKLILLVDDDPVFRRMTKGYLQQDGYQVLEAENGLDGLRKLRDSKPDLILCDLSMPVLNGIEFVEEVSLAYPSLPLIVVSATEEMADVAKALRFGIKDFLPKPITNHDHLTSSIENILANDEHQRDFVSCWYGADSQGGIPEEQELHWHLQYLKDNPNAARELLNALLPEKDSQLGGWKCSYRLLQSAELMPLVFDYAWLMNGQFVFYLVDAASHEDCGAASTLLVRALFHDYVRNLRNFSVELKDLAEIIERGICCSDCIGKVSALFGVADVAGGTLSLLPAGLNCQWSNGYVQHRVTSGVQLGDNSLRNFITKDLPIRSACQITLSQPSAYSFTLDLYQGCEV
ncbi:two-component system response regulator [Vibrio metoecus]|uniref:Two-component system response regulator n=2 Tax=Vibrio metoecus TaxID=1481663 RepID=A0A271VVE4_VIBMT|nr:two-component system response regulator [Vibrio metoecus]PAR24204.1 two-component system response regulator [Vibrio metoecus]PAR27746.1 two-component system response regulator [Vibrio metoecus]PAR31992.1 two-component system response regulator [Vibrio metoecus]PAR37707.1 two-component system response regulator [Vibrio metoecus]